jgi:hypothetical protein
MLIQDEVVKLTLDPPFKYIADISKAGKRKFSIVIKWYFIAKGLLSDNFGGDMNDYCKRFYDALKKIDAGTREEKGGRSIQESPSESPRRLATTTNESSEPDEPRNSRGGLRSAYRAEHADATTQALPRTQLTNQAEARSEDIDSQEESDYTRLRAYLSSHNALYLLDNIPPAASLEFVAQSFIPTARPQKLFVGWHARTNDEIFAYMRPSRNHHDINFWVEDPRRPLQIYQLRTEEVAKQRLLHPFSKTFPKDGSAGMDQGDRARLTLMVKWYFVESGVAGDVVLKETKAFPERLKSALEYIAQRMGKAATKPPVEPVRNHEEKRRYEDTPVDENDIQTTLTLNTSPAQPSYTLPATTLPTHALPIHSSPLSQSHSKRPPKRSAEDAQFSSMAATLAQDQLFTSQLNSIDEELEVFEMKRLAFIEDLEEKRLAFMEGWDKERKKMVERRMEVDQKRGGVRKRFKRMSAALAREVEGNDGSGDKEGKEEEMEREDRDNWEARKGMGDSEGGYRYRYIVGSSKEDRDEDEG